MKEKELKIVDQKADSPKNFYEAGKKILKDRAKEAKNTWLHWNREASKQNENVNMVRRKIEGLLSTLVIESQRLKMCHHNEERFKTEYEMLRDRLVELETSKL